MTIKSWLAHEHLSIGEARLVGTYAATTGKEAIVVDVTYPRATIRNLAFDYRHAFDTPHPASRVRCLDPAFEGP